MNPGMHSGHTNTAAFNDIAASRLSTYLFVASGTTIFTAPKNAWYGFWVVGAGGSGACVYRTNGGMATGGAGAGFSYKKVYLQAGQQVNITLGAGGAAVLSSNANGNAGGNTVISGPNLSIAIPGAPGGLYSVTPGATLVGSSGSVASGGDINYKGGDSASISQGYVDQTTIALGGSSSGSPFGNGFTAGSAGGVLTAGALRASGGASIFFNSANVNTAGAGVEVSGGAGTGNQNYAGTITNGGACRTGENSAAVNGTGAAETAHSSGISLLLNGMVNEINPFRRLYGGGYVTGANTNLGGFAAGPGAGSGAVYSGTLNGNAVTANGGTCGGSGGAAGDSLTALTSCISGIPGIGAGSGGVAAAAFGSVFSRAGGNAFCCIEMEG